MAELKECLSVDLTAAKKVASWVVTTAVRTAALLVLTMAVSSGLHLAEYLVDRMVECLAAY